MANRDAKLIERTLKDFSLNVMSGSGGNEYQVAQMFTDVNKWYADKRKEGFEKGWRGIIFGFKTNEEVRPLFKAMLEKCGLDLSLKYYYLHSASCTSYGDGSLISVFSFGYDASNYVGTSAHLTYDEKKLTEDSTLSDMIDVVEFPKNNVELLDYFPQALYLTIQYRNDMSNEPNKIVPFDIRDFLPMLTIYEGAGPE